MLKQAKKVHREFQSDKHVLKFLKVIMHPRLMTQPLGLAMAQKFHQTGDRGDHEKITYEVSDVKALEYPCAVWSRSWPSSRVHWPPFPTLVFGCVNAGVRDWNYILSFSACVDFYWIFYNSIIGSIHIFVIVQTWHQFWRTQRNDVRAHMRKQMFADGCQNFSGFSHDFAGTQGLWWDV